MSFYQREASTLVKDYCTCGKKIAQFWTAILDLSTKIFAWSIARHDPAGDLIRTSSWLHETLRREQQNERGSLLHIRAARKTNAVVV